MRNLWRLLAFDIAAPLAAIAALSAIGVVLGWPVWWVAVCSVSMLLIVEGVVVNVVLLRRDAVTLGTDDDGPRLRLVVAALATAAVVAASVVGFMRWTQPDRDFTRDSAQVVAVAADMAEATATFDPADPTAGRRQAAAMMVPERAEALENELAKSAADLARDHIKTQATVLSGGVEALGPSVASVVTVLRVAQTAPGESPDHAVVALRMPLTKRDNHWMVVDVAPIHRR